MVKKNKGLSVGNLIQVYKLRQGVSKQNYKWQHHTAVAFVLFPYNDRLVFSAVI